MCLIAVIFTCTYTKYVLMPVTSSVKYKPKAVVYVRLRFYNFDLPEHENNVQQWCTNICTWIKMHHLGLLGLQVHHNHIKIIRTNLVNTVPIPHQFCKRHYTIFVSANTRLILYALKCTTFSAHLNNWDYSQTAPTSANF